jgi:tripartite-type tricarboxylate transporter receptor subunit TctC
MRILSYSKEAKKKLSDMKLSDYLKELLKSGDLPEYFKEKKWSERFETIEDYEHYLKIVQMKAQDDIF